MTKERKLREIFINLGKTYYEQTLDYEEEYDRSLSDDYYEGIGRQVFEVIYNIHRYNKYGYYAIPYYLLDEDVKPSDAAILLETTEEDVIDRAVEYIIKLRRYPIPEGEQIEESDFDYFYAVMDEIYYSDFEHGLIRGDDFVKYCYRRGYNNVRGLICLMDDEVGLSVQDVINITGMDQEEGELNYLETIRDLHSSDKDFIEHAYFYGGLSEEAISKFLGRNCSRTIKRLEKEYDT